MPPLAFVEAYSPDDDQVTVKLVGELDGESRWKVQRKLDLLEECPQLTIDLSRTTFIDRDSARMLVHCRERARLQGRSIGIVNASPTVDQMLTTGDGDTYRPPEVTTTDAERSNPDSVQIVRLQCDACGAQTFRPETSTRRACDECGSPLEVVAVFRDRRQRQTSVEVDRRH